MKKQSPILGQRERLAPASLNLTMPLHEYAYLRL